MLTAIAPFKRINAWDWTKVPSGRLGAQKSQHIFNETITQARQAGLVSDRLQIIDI